MERTRTRRLRRRENEERSRRKRVRPKFAPPRRVDVDKKRADAAEKDRRTEAIEKMRQKGSVATFGQRSAAMRDRDADDEERGANERRPSRPTSSGAREKRGDELGDAENRQRRRRPTAAFFKAGRERRGKRLLQRRTLRRSRGVGEEFDDIVVGRQTIHIIYKGEFIRSLSREAGNGNAAKDEATPKKATGQRDRRVGQAFQNYTPNLVRVKNRRNKVRRKIGRETTKR